MANHIVKNLTITATAKVVCNSNSYNVNKPAKLPSVTPNPPGDIGIEPSMTDAEYMYNKLKNSIKFIPNACKIKRIPTASIIRKIIVNPEHEQMVLRSDECLIILCDSSILLENF